MSRQFTLALLFCSLLFSCDSAKSEESSVYFKLASLEHGGTPTPAEVNAFQAALEKLHKKCPGDAPDRLGDYAYFLKKELIKKGHQQTILASIAAMERSIPDGETMPNCNEIAAALIVLTEDK